MAKQLNPDYKVPIGQKDFEQDARIENLDQMYERGLLALEFAKEEYKMADKVFKEGHPDRKRKLAERYALIRYLQDVLVLIDQQRTPF